MELTGKIALVTGSTSGIGRATARALAARGAHILVSGRDAERGAKTVAAILADGGQADFLPADLRDAESARDLARRAVETAGRIDILVNNAGIGAFGPTDAVTEQDFDATYAVNVKAPFFLVAALAPAMAERGEGAIVSLTTMVAGFGRPGMALYGSSKAAVSLLTKAWAAEFGPHGVRVNAVSPGPVRTEGTAPMGEALDQIASQAPAGRVADPSEIAEAIAYLVGNQAAFVQGVVLPVDGGRAAI
ncbi:SDR family NAD(P)-dependent oxidoreductase [Streptacidiphilus jiangxiensis]|uniref:NAD(P)-dependent dehydrogenase, short-chain alcohol dehydrogenase family n=1 Tax=Streptacidiphilus jiangxiensis TaxID=235985 RepID=A0A1H7WDY9_STRJI|nr:glucose 1-dehydrogenase [Streptacidiphilus jiangxiensis]SEM19792.1 NAD(P)-dependent dehydrogenase, short-chain alcohol dehydrogenase family [Streptacidiphilus jiangxiensis]